MKFKFLITFLETRQRKSYKDHDKYLHFVWGYFINFIIIALSIILFNVYIGLAICFTLVVGLEYLQKINGGTNSIKEQILDITAGFITAPVWAWVLPYVIVL